MCTLRIGYGVADITPPLGVELCGYGYYPERRAESIRDPLYARAVLLMNHEQNLLLLQCDLIGLPLQMVHKLRTRIQHSLGMESLHTMIAASHTHTGPATGVLYGCGEVDADYLACLEVRLIEACQRAYGTIREVDRIRCFTTPITSLGYNRVRKDQSISHALKCILLNFSQGKPLVLLSAGCHPVTLGKAVSVSADYPGQAVHAFAQDGYDAIFLNSFCGDIDPVTNQEKWGSGSFESISQVGNDVLKAFYNGLASAVDMTNLTLFAQEMIFNLKLQPLTKVDIDVIEEKYHTEAGCQSNMYRLIHQWCQYILSTLQVNDPYNESISVQIFCIGDITILGFPAEIFSSLGQRIEASLPDRFFLLLGNTNGTMRYIADRCDILHKGYAGYVSSFIYNRLPLVAGEGERLIENVIASIETPPLQR